MQSQIIHLIRYAKSKGCTISVHDGEEWDVKRSENEREILEAINAVEECQIIIHNPSGEKAAWALVIPSLDADEQVADYSSKDGKWMDHWAVNYEKGLKA